MVSMKFPRPRVPEPSPTARRRTVAPVTGATIENAQPVQHRFVVSTTDFTSRTGESQQNYAVTMYAPTGHEASLRALNLISTRFAPEVMPRVTSIECDMGCLDRYHA